MAEKKELKREDLNIFQRMAEVMKAIEYLKKDDNVEFGSTKYKAISEEKVTTIVREQLIKWGLVIYPTQQISHKEGNLTSVDTTYNLVNVDKPEEMIVIASSGQGADSQDKGVGKAMTYAFKYALMRTFAIPTGEDPDKISSEELTAEFNNQDEKKQPADPKLLGDMKKVLEENSIDPKGVIKYVNDKYGNNRKSVDEFNGEEYYYATMAIQKKLEGK